MKPIGQHFAKELETAGLLGLPFSWGDDGSFTFSEAMAPAQIDAVMAVYAAHDPDAVLADPVPEVVSMRQARLALLKSGLLATVQSAVDSMPGAEGDAARIEWEFSSTVERNRPLVQSLGAALSLTEAQLDDLFRIAATL